MKLLFFIQNMGQGGAQRSLLTLLPVLREQHQHEVYLAFWEEEDVAFDIPNTIHSIRLGRYCVKNSKIANYIHSIYVVKKTIKMINPDRVIATMCDMYCKVFFGNITIGKKLFVWEHTSMGRKMQIESEFARKYLYKFADKVILLTNKDKTLVDKRYKDIVVIPNAVPFDCTHIATYRNNIVLAIGRLDVWNIKGFDLLIQMWRQIVTKHPCWKLHIAGGGSGSNVRKVKSFIEEFNVSNSVELLGYRTDIDNLLKESKIFALSSRIEGFPMSVIEAMSLGNACVCFSVGGAMSDIITDGSDGYIVNDGDLQAFIEKMDVLMRSDEEITRISTNAVESVKRFTPYNVANLWNQILM